MSAAVVTWASLKGGAGKTTGGLNLAVAAEGQGIPTAVIDLDPQQAAAKWGDARQPGNRPPVLSAMAARLPQAIAEAEAAGAKLVVIDTAAHSESILNPAIDVADLVLMPCRPTVIDLQHLSATAGLIAARRKLAAVVLNAAPPRAGELEQARALVERMNLPLAPVALSNLVAYARAIAAGQGVTEYEPGGKAAREVEELLGWITQHLNISSRLSVECSAIKQVGR